MIPQPAARGRDGAANCAVVPLEFLGPTIGTDGEVEFAVGRPDVIAEQRRRAELATSNDITHRQDGGQQMRQPLPSIGTVLVKLRRDDGYRDVSGVSERHSGILESHLATYRC